MAPPYGRVEGHEPRVLIVANGPSAAGVDIPDDLDAHVIVVNGALEWCRPADAFFTLDPSEYVRSLVARGGDIDFYMAVPEDYGTSNAFVQSHRAPAEPYVTYLRRVTGDGVRGACGTLATDPGEIHTGNSAWGALGVAWHLGAERVAFIGLDCTRDPYPYTGGSPRHDFDHVPDLFASAVPQLEARGVTVLNGSPRSMVTCFPRVEAGVALEWLVD